MSEHTWIKKEIPYLDSVDEFLYEVHALSELIGSKNVIQLEGLVIDNDNKLIKGLLLAYAEQGALVDIRYGSKEGYTARLPWARRERWAKQTIQGLINLHKAGFVHGDFTLSNIMIDANNEAQIIDINRRGCPTSWESPEMVPLLESGQRLLLPMFSAPTFPDLCRQDPKGEHACGNEELKHRTHSFKGFDSGLLDMDPDCALSEHCSLDLAGIVGHETLNVGQQFGGDGVSQALTNHEELIRWDMVSLLVLAVRLIPKTASKPYFRCPFSLK